MIAPRPDTRGGPGREPSETVCFQPFTSVVDAHGYATSARFTTSCEVRLGSWCSAPAGVVDMAWPRTVRNCTKSFAKIRSSVQSIATRIFLSRRGSLLRYTVRQSHQAKKPEKL